MGDPPAEVVERAKQAAGLAAAQMVQNGMVIGLGTGSTARYFIEALGAKIDQGLTVTGVATSKVTARLAERVRIPLTELDGSLCLDMDVDGADEIDRELNVLKGGGGALLHEKIVALASKQFVVIADESKFVDSLASRHPIPAEVVVFGWKATRDHMFNHLGVRQSIRGGEDAPFVTDSGNLIVDVGLPQGVDVFAFAERLKGLSGVIDHGIFRGVVSTVVVGYWDGTVRTVERRLLPIRH